MVHNLDCLPIYYVLYNIIYFGILNVQIPHYGVEIGVVKGNENQSSLSGGAVKAV